MRITEHERRLAVFRVSDVHVNDAAYFEALHAAFAERGLVRAFYELLLTRDIARFGDTGNLQASRPLSAYWLGCRAANVDPLRRFLSALINARLAHAAAPAAAVEGQDEEDEAVGDALVPASALYARYLAFWHRLFPAGAAKRPPLSRPFFGFELRQMAGVTHVRRAAFNAYAFDYAALRAFLERTHEFDTDARL